RYAFAYGADAVYAGQPRYSLRVRNNEFSLENLAIGINEAHENNKKLYVVSNIAPHNSKVKTYIKDLEPVIQCNPDALIMSDPGLIMMVKEKWPDAEIHLSVQSNVVNYASVKFWQNMGISRIILSRELSFKEIEEIRHECPDIELEVFVHGALCMAYSGRCLLSGYINHRDANQGVCTNACRWKYKTEEAKEDEWGNVTVEEKPMEEKVFLIEENNQYKTDRDMTAYEDEHGTYLFNSKDLRIIHHVEKLVKLGVDCLKIEGRTKSHFYVARTAQCYRKAIDDAIAGKPFDMTLMDQLESLANRGYTEGLFRRHVHDEYQNYEQGNSVSTKQKFAGEITGYNETTGMAEINVKNRFEVGDSIEIMTPAGNHSMQLEKIENKNGQAMDAAPGSGHVVYIPIPNISASDLSNALLLNNVKNT
ncbi:MAG: tRNA 5-hydroxyuridine modification protein YegQ, partial [Coxiellaceae bacterium]|nr:tRNA 5-hydroxyuridine modification protein YegQ [Coxiellaceae bacterium]